MARGRRLEPRDLICSGDYPRKHRVQGVATRLAENERNRIGKKRVRLKGKKQAAGLTSQAWVGERGTKQ
jgi:hypothetical protein